MSNKAALSALLCDLVALPSVTPEGDAGKTRPGEAAIGSFVAAYLRKLGGDVKVDFVQPGRPNVIARFQSRRKGAPTIALVPHLDTVGIRGMTVAAHQPVIRSGRLYGRGASDTKGPMAAALWALASWLGKKEASQSNVTWIFAATMGEEELSTGARALCAGGFHADFAIALEPTDLKIIHASKGVLRLWVEARGRAAHGARPGRGVNAIYKMLPFLAACENRLAPAFARAAHPRLGGASLNLGIVQGGGELNVVPDHCRAGLDIRTHPELDNKAARALVKQSARGLAVVTHREGPPFVLEARHPWVRELAPYSSGLGVSPWFSDANILNAHGIPAVAYGPGSMAQAHTSNEFIKLSALEAGAKALEGFIGNISRGPTPR